jgi:type VI secretion system secreted protein Hcp
MKPTYVSTQVSGPGLGRIHSIKPVLLGATLALGLATSADAAQQIFLHFPGITGSSVDSKHRGDVILSGFSANASRTVAPGGVGKVVCGQVTIVKIIDQSSPQFLGLLFKGVDTRGPATITFEQIGERPYDYYMIELMDVSITSIAQADPQDITVTETIVLHAARYKYTFTPQKPDGSLDNPVSFGFDCNTGKAF